ncbi:MAG: transcription termination/antitermination protein NusG [Lentisphaeria bacterium]
MEDVNKNNNLNNPLGQLGGAPDAGKWFVVHVLSGHEQRVRKSIVQTTKLEGSNYGIYEILIAQEDVTEVKHGKKTTRSRKFFPGYVLVRMDLLKEDGTMNTEGWHFINSINGVIGFLGGDKASPLSDQEFEEIRSAMTGEEAVVGPKIQFEVNETVIIKEGPFTNFEGVVSSIEPTSGKVTLMVSIFGRSTPVELEYWQIERQ